MCDLCHGLPGCPVCEKTPDLTTCPECGGHGYRYYALVIPTGDAVEVPEHEWALLPETEDEALRQGLDRCRWEECRCPMCDGDGEVLKPSYDDELYYAFNL